MSDAPERIWVDLEPNSNGPMTAYRHIGSWPGVRHEYVRADLSVAEVARVLLNDPEVKRFMHRPGYALSIHDFLNALAKEPSHE